jgi:hypothetical protein
MKAIQRLLRTIVQGRRHGEKAGGTYLTARPMRNAKFPIFL